MLRDIDINWDDYPIHFRRGTYIQRRTVERSFTNSELKLLPPRHIAHENPTVKFSRSTVTAVQMPPITSIANRESVIYEGAEPVCK